MQWHFDDISNSIHCKVRGEIAFPFPNFNGATVEVWEWNENSSHTLLGMRSHSNGLFWLEFTCTRIVRTFSLITTDYCRPFQVKVWCPMEDKPLSSLLIIQFSAAHIRHQTRCVSSTHPLSGVLIALTWNTLTIFGIHVIYYYVEQSRCMLIRY